MYSAGVTGHNVTPFISILYQIFDVYFFDIYFLFALHLQK